MSKGHRDLLLFCLIFAASFAATASLRAAYPQTVPPRFSDPFLVGILVLAYKGSMRYALVLFAFSLAINVYYLAPLDGRDLYQIGSYAILSLLVLWITQTLRRRTPQNPS